MIPIKIETLLDGRRVEQNRIEYKEGFNPSDIVHTICAYANDIAGVDGGYLVIGVKARWNTRFATRGFATGMP